MKHMSTVGIRALKQNASAIVADAVAGETVTITDRGRAVAQLTAIPTSRLRALIDSGRARASRHDIAELPAPGPGPVESAVSVALSEMRDAERN
jgi:prevent-host-death family protein